MTAPPLVGCVVWSPAPILFINTLEMECYEGEVQPYQKTDYKLMVMMMRSKLVSDTIKNSDGYILTFYH